MPAADAARILRCAVDGRDLHGRGPRHARSSAGAALCLSRAGGLCAPDRYFGRGVDRLSGRPTQGRRRGGANLRYLGGRAAAGANSRAGASRRPGALSTACARSNRTRKIIGFPRGAGTMLPHYVAAQRRRCRRSRLDGRSDFRARPDPEPPCRCKAISIRWHCVPAAPRSTAAVDAVMRGFAGGPFIFNLGHGILPDTPIAHVEQMLKRVRGS